MLQLPSHVQALRCMGIGRLWDGDHGREAMPHLMGYIMEYCRKPTITLDCPKEDILLDHTFCESFFFNDNGNLYSVLKRGREIMLRCISASSCCSVPPPVNIPLCFNATEAPWTCFYEDRSRLLYILYNRSVLLKYDMKAQKGGTSIHFPHVPRSSLNNNQSGTGKKGPTIMVVGSSFYIGIVSRHESLGHSAVRYHFNIFCAKLTRTSEMRLIFSDSLVSPIHVHDPSSLLTFLYSSPHGIAIRYTSDHTMHTVTLEMLRTENPVLFSEKREETLQREHVNSRIIELKGSTDFNLQPNEIVQIAILEWQTYKASEPPTKQRCVKESNRKGRSSLIAFIAGKYEAYESQGLLEDLTITDATHCALWEWQMARNYNAVESEKVFNTVDGESTVSGSSNMSDKAEGGSSHEGGASSDEAVLDIRPIIEQEDDQTALSSEHLGDTSSRCTKWTADEEKELLRAHDIYGEDFEAALESGQFKFSVGRTAVSLKRKYRRL
ncbi:hypothetical protein FOL47_005649 [Perkinsus chesapeaki]|uniref:Uncharacterized protein n=1 Tax=Perkinsus chesapeaki TaxID=330153 RepID=A0A7J6LWL3_PERCH|nr:hypothetical protein FOL47_005649 [Perkinsus chesapeaki]